MSSRFPALIFSLCCCCFSINSQFSLLPFMGCLFYLGIIGRPLLKTLSCTRCLWFSGTPPTFKSCLCLQRGMHHNTPTPFSLLSSHLPSWNLKPHLALPFQIFSSLPKPQSLSPGPFCYADSHSSDNSNKMASLVSHNSKSVSKLE